MKFLVRIISEHRLKAISLMFKTEIFGPHLVCKSTWWRCGKAGGALAPLLYLERLFADAGNV